ncbi:MAG TPA: HDIG domain-containing protein, partial [Nitrospirota bacterium]|nr:HDIG domain-containing protein [Nitrospirota bacterium]
MASLKAERARAGAGMKKAQPKPLSMQRQSLDIKAQISGERIRKAVLGAGLVLALTLLLTDYSELADFAIPDALQSFAGLLLIVSLPVYILYRDLRRYKKAITGDLPKLLLLCIIIVGAVLISRVSAEIFTTFTGNIPGVGGSAGRFAVPIATAAMLATLLFDIHIGIVVSIVMSIFGGILLHDEPLFAFYTFMGSMIASFSVIRCAQRSALLKAGLFVALANVATVVCLDLYQHELFTRLGLYDMAAAAAGGFLSAMLVSGILPLLESLFKVVTDISLLEYSDLNRPLLKQLMVSAPGTYHHSVIIGTLAEAAAESVAVNPLMARVASYYHDIGKIRKPEYFIENQAKGENRHDRLTPSMSSLVIAAHVKDGMELAREYKLPPQITDIIRQHHGTALMTYFYEKAKGAEADPALVNEEDYRYPGPRPQTKVAAIVMLADAVEAASRVLDNPTP